MRALFWLAQQYGMVGLHTQAGALYAEAAGTEATNLEAQINLASFLARTKSIEEARAAVSRCRELDASSEWVRYLSAHLDRRENKLAEAERQCRELITSGVKLPQVRYSCFSELANVLDKMGRFDEAVASLEEGKKSIRQPLSVAADWRAWFKVPEEEVGRVKSLPKNILEKWGKTFPPEARVAVGPVAFLSGSSRSGTTLLERILDAHPAVAACDESMVFKKIGPRIDISADSIPAPTLNVMRELYINSMGVVLGTLPGGKTLLDKNPARTVWLPAFLRTFPELRVLIALRDPRDVIISLYFQDHPSTNPLTVEQLAYYYTLVMDCWLAVREWDGLTWMETKYEDVVVDPRKEGGRVTRFLGLEWHENQERFHEHNREKPILSNNYTDVTQPVYKRAVGRWRVYGKLLAPALSMLGPYCKKFGYE
ncbi:MAG TPA: sulfotransferase [Opitutales bacterium]|nr:sulfotransferase [Opitutales bacterium]